MKIFDGPCPVCGFSKFEQKDVLWSELIDAWELSPNEAVYINRQQGLHCLGCGNNLRAMALAITIIEAYGFKDITLTQFCNISKEIHILEINPAGNLTSIFQNMPNHKLIEYPQFNMESLSIDSESYDLIIHSDTLEHVPDPVRGLQECRRVLKPKGLCIFTIPIIVDRMSRSRNSLPPSYHGQQCDDKDDFIVHTEFGADFWKYVVWAGFCHYTVNVLEYPSAIAVVAER